VVALWLISGWGEVEQEQPCSTGSLPGESFFSQQLAALKICFSVVLGLVWWPDVLQNE